MSPAQVYYYLKQHESSDGPKKGDVSSLRATQALIKQRKK